MATRLITEPTEEPITLAEAKLWAKIDNDVDDSLIEDILIPSVRRMWTARTHRASTTAVYEYISNGFPWSGIRLLYPPLISIDSFLYLDALGMQQMVAAADYYVDTTAEPGTVQPIYDGEWPETRNDLNAVRIRYQAGYGAAADVPQSAKLWMLCAVADRYKHRDTMIVGTSVEPLPDRFMEGLLDEFYIPYVI